MMLPNADRAVVQQKKIVEYLLNQTHRQGASKARFFARFGFRVEEWNVLAIALRENGRQNEVVKICETGFGPQYRVDGELTAPDGRRPRIRTVWQGDENQSAPRLITAYPLEVYL